MDYFLLENQEKLEHYSNLNVIKDINVMELCLLVIWLSKNNPKKAKEIAIYINDANRI